MPPVEHCYLYNPGLCQQHYGNHRFAPHAYTVVPLGLAEAIRKAGLPLLIEGDQDFPEIWAVYSGQRQV